MAATGGARAVPPRMRARLERTRSARSTTSPISPMSQTVVDDPQFWQFKSEVSDFPHGIYDGDTYRLDIDQGFRMRMEAAKVRLADIDTPSIKGEERPEGLAARDRVRELLEPPTELAVMPRAGDPQKYGRYLVDVHFTPYPLAGEASDEWHDLAAVLLAEGHAVPYD